MKKLILVLLSFLSFASYGQAEYEKIAITDNVATASTSKIVSQQPGTGELNYINATALPLSTAAINALKLKADLSTGLLKNGLVQANADPTKINITAGIGIISNFDDPENPTSTIINFPDFIGVTPAYLNTGNITYFAINSSAAVVMQAAPFTNEQRRGLIVLGAAIHSNLTTVNLVNNISAPTNASTNQLHDFMEAIGALNISGNKYGGNGNLTINKSAGTIFKLGVNFANNWKDPHNLYLAPQNALTFRYRTQNGTEGADVTALNPAVYDLANVLTTVPPNRFTIQTVTLFQTGATRIQYGQSTYATMTEAESAILTRAFVVEPNIAANGITRAYIILRNSTTSLLNASDAKIVEAQKFGGVASGGVALTDSAIIAALGYTPENVANKSATLTPSDTLYPTNNAVLSALPTNYATVVYVNATSPLTATIFDDVNPPVTNDDALKIDTDNLYIGTDASTWVYNGSTYVTKTLPASSNFKISGIEVDAGNNKTSSIYREGSIASNAFVSSNAGMFINRDGSDTAQNGGFMAFANAVSSNINMFQLNASNGLDLWNYAASVWSKKFSFSSSGALTANSFIKTGGTSSQFLKGDGTIDSSIYQPLLVSGTNIKTINGSSILGSGDLVVSGGGSGDMILASAQTNTGVKTFLDGTLGLRNVANTFTSYFANTNTASRTYTFPDKSGAVFIDADFTVFGTGPGNTGVGLLVLASNTTGYNNTAVGNSALNSNTTGFQNTALGWSALKSNIIGSNNTAFGYKALFSNTGSENTGIGDAALELNSSGIRNVGIGYSALNANTTGTSGVAIGFQALKSNQTGGSNVAVGMNSLLNNTASNNTAFGYQASSLNTSGEGNVSGGYNALYNNTTGSYNITFGQNAARYISGDAANNTISNNSIFIGSSTRPLASNQTNQIVIGHNATGAGSNTATIGHTDITKTFLRGVINTAKTYTVATLPTGILGDKTIVTDATAPTYLGALTGGGSVVCPVFFNGTTWVSN